MKIGSRVKSIRYAIFGGGGDEFLWLVVCHDKWLSFC